MSTPSRETRSPTRAPRQNVRLAPEKKLTDLELRFIDRYLVDFNGTRAYMEVSNSKSPNAAKVAAVKLLQREPVLEEMRRRRGLTAAKCSKTAQDVIEELIKLGFSNMSDYLKINSSGLPYVDLNDLPPEKMAAIQEVTVESYVEKGVDADGEVEEREVKKVKLKLHDKRGPLVDVGKHLGVFKEGKEAPQEFEFTVSIGTRNADGTSTAAQVQVRSPVGVRETE